MLALQIEQIQWLIYQEIHTMEKVVMQDLYVVARLMSTIRDVERPIIRGDGRGEPQTNRLGLVTSC